MVTHCTDLEHDGASGESEVVEQTTLALPQRPRRTTVLLSRDQLLTITRTRSHASNEDTDDDDDEKEEDSFIDEESLQPVDRKGYTDSVVSAKSKIDLEKSTGSSIEKLPMVSTSTAGPTLTSTASDIDPVLSQPGALQVRGVHLTTLGEDEGNIEGMTNPPSGRVATAKVISHDELEAQIRQQVLSEAVVAEVVTSSPEPTKSFPNETPTKRNILFFFFMFLLLLVGVVGLTAWVVIRRSHADDDTIIPDKEAGGAISPGPQDNNDATLQDNELLAGNDASPDDDKYTDDNSNTDDYQSTDVGLDNLLTVLEAKSPLVTEVNSPQYKAYQWMYDNDIDPDDSFFWDYYALATLYFATNGPATWTRRDNWLNHTTSPCNWYPGTLCRHDENDRNDGARLQESQPTMIKTLVLSDNQLDGSLPDEISLFTALEVLILDDNPLLVGSLISTIGSLPSLLQFSARRVGFVGTFPSGLDRLTQLRSFELQGVTGMNGTSFPTELWTLPQLSLLSLEGIGVTGSLPQTTQSPVEVYLGGNLLTGSLPDLTDSDWIRLQVLDLKNNELSGTIPSGLSRRWPDSLSVLKLEGNNFVGEVASCNSFEERTINSGVSPVFSSDCLDDVQCECCTSCCSRGNNCQESDR